MKVARTVLRRGRAGNRSSLFGEALINGLQKAVAQWNPAVLTISYLPYLFSSPDDMRLFEPLLDQIKLLTTSSGIITVVTSFGGSWYGDRLLASKADRVIRIVHPSKNLIKITDNGRVFEHIPVPEGQTRFTDFINIDSGGDALGQNSTQLQDAA